MTLAELDGWQPTVAEMDNQTPMYQHEMELHSALARKLISVLARMPGGPQRMMEISRFCRFDPRATANYLHRIRAKTVWPPAILKEGKGYRVRGDLRQWLRMRSGLFRKEFDYPEER